MQALALPTASFAVAMVAAVADQNPESPSASSVAKVEEPEPFQFHQRVVLVIAPEDSIVSSAAQPHQKNLFSIH